MAGRFSEFLEKGQLPQYLLRTGPIKLADMFAQSPDRTKTLITVLGLMKEGEVRIEGDANAKRLFEGLATELAESIDESPPLLLVAARLHESLGNPAFGNLLVSLSENGFRKAAALT
jgi:hypothetical protein